VIWVEPILPYRFFADLSGFFFALEVPEMDHLTVDADLGTPFFAALVPNNTDHAARIVLVR